MKRFHHLFEKDSHVFGALLGIATPAVLYVIFNSILSLMPFISQATGNPGNKIMLLSLAGNLLWVRYFLVVKKAENTGIALVSITLLAVIVFFIFFR